ARLPSRFVLPPPPPFPPPPFPSAVGVAPMIRPRLLPWAALAAALAGCQAAPRGACQTTNRLPITELVDRERVDDAVPLVDVALCEALAARVQKSANPADAPARRVNALVPSGGRPS